MFGSIPQIFSNPLQDALRYFNSRLQVNNHNSHFPTILHITIRYKIHWINIWSYAKLLEIGNCDCWLVILSWNTWRHPREDLWRSKGLIQTFPTTLGTMSGFDCWNFCQTLRIMNGQNSYSVIIKYFQRHPCSHNNYIGFLSLPLFWLGTGAYPILCNWRTWWWWACGRGQLKGPFLTWCLLFKQTFPGWDALIKLDGFF